MVTGYFLKQIADALELIEESIDSIIHDRKRKIRTIEYLKMEAI